MHSFSSKTYQKPMMVKGNNFCPASLLVLFSITFLQIINTIARTTTTTDAFMHVQQRSHTSAISRPVIHNWSSNLFMSNESHPFETVNDKTETTTIYTSTTSNGEKNNSTSSLHKLEGKLMKQLRQLSLKYRMIEDGDHIMCAVSGGKDSATMLYLLLALQKKLQKSGVNFDITAVHLNQMQPGYDGKPLVAWLDKLVEEEGSLLKYKIIEEDTYSIVLDKTPENKTYCSMCSRLRRGILYTIAHDIKANKIALGHHGDDAIQTLLLNFIHAGQMKSMPARYYSRDRDVHVIRPLISCLEDDIAIFAQEMHFPILPCNLCGTQPDAQRAKVKLLVDTTLTMLNPNAKRNMINAMGDVRPSHLLDVELRAACGLDGVTGETLDFHRVKTIKGYEDADESSSSSSSESPTKLVEESINQLQFESKSRIESLL